MTILRLSCVTRSLLLLIAQIGAVPGRNGKPGKILIFTDARKQKRYPEKFYEEENKSFLPCHIALCRKNILLCLSLTGYRPSPQEFRQMTNTVLTPSMAALRMPAATCACGLPMRCRRSFQTIRSHFYS
jgi:hypothetical protein